MSDQYEEVKVRDVFTLWILLSLISFLHDRDLVTWRNLSADWQVMWLNLLTLASVGLALKFTLLLLPRATAARTGRFLASPLLAPNSLERSRPFRAVPGLVLRAGTCLGVLILYYWVYWKLVNTVHLRSIVLSYLAVPAVYLVSEVFAAMVSILWLPSGWLLPVLHRNPFASRSLADFWGRRWNLWMSDWFRYAILARMRRRPELALWVIFFLSGLLHEYVLNLSLWWVTGRKLFGTMMLYFLLQPVGMLIERRILKDHPRANILFVWVIVFAPVPLVFHESMLRTLHLWPK